MDVAKVGGGTRATLIRVGERLMARDGIWSVDLVDIQREAGQRNRSAIQYHFTDRHGLVRAIVDEHRWPINEERHLVLDRLEESGDLTVRSLIEAAVLPLSDSLWTPSGRDYLIVHAELTLRFATRRVHDATTVHTDSATRTIELLAAVLTGPPKERTRRAEQALLAVPQMLATTAASIQRREITVARARARPGEVVDFVTAALSI